MSDPSNALTPENYFDSIHKHKHLKREESILERQDWLCAGGRVGQSTHLQKKYGSMISASRLGCVICGNERHSSKIFFCKQFKELEPSKKLKSTDAYLFRNWNCIREGSFLYHFFLSLREGYNKKESGKTKH